MEFFKKWRATTLAIIFQKSNLFYRFCTNLYDPLDSDPVFLYPSSTVFVMSQTVTGCGEDEPRGSYSPILYHTSFFYLNNRVLFLL